MVIALYYRKLTGKISPVLSTRVQISAAAKTTEKGEKVDLCWSVVTSFPQLGDFLVTQIFFKFCKYFSRTPYMSLPPTCNLHASQAWPAQTHPPSLPQRLDLHRCGFLLSRHKHTLQQCKTLISCTSLGCS